MVAGGMAGVIIISDLTIRNGWCYHLAEEWPIDQRCKAAGVNNDQLLSYDQLTPDCPEQSKQPEVSHKKRETKVREERNKSGLLQFAFRLAADWENNADS